MTATATTPASTEHTGAALVFDDVDVRFGTEFGTVHAVKGVSLEVQPGEVVALVGESGSGKSVTSMTAMRLLPPNARIGGRVVVNGHEVNKIPDREMRRLRGNDIAMVFQEPMTALNPVLTIGTQLTESLELHGIAAGRAAQARAVELLEMVGIPEPARRVKQYPHELSGGQRQRVVIAIAISCDPRVIIADEPTTALDVTVQADILDLLRSLKDKLNTGILLITHNMGVVADMADRVAVMFKGELVEQGTAQEVLLNPQHEYTKVLLGAVPRLGAGRGQMGINIVEMDEELAGLGRRGHAGPGDRPAQPGHRVPAPGQASVPCRRRRELHGPPGRDRRAGRRVRVGQVHDRPLRARADPRRRW